MSFRPSAARGVSLSLATARSFGIASAFLFALSSCIAIAQAQTPAATPQASPASQSNTSASQQKPARVTTTVVVHGETKDNYLPESVTLGTLGSEPLQSAPVSATVITRDLLNDQVSRLLSDVVKNDASVLNDYVPVGYYGGYEIRGFIVDLATGFEIDGMTVAGEQDVPLENKQSVEILKGIASVESGVTTAGGLIDYVTKRPANIQTLDFATDHRGTAYGAIDFGHLFGRQNQVGMRLNLAGERIVPYMNDTNGWRAVGAGAADWKIDEHTVLKGDFEYQHKTERDGSGYQLLSGNPLPTVPDINSLFRSTMPGDQSWAPPDTYDTFNANARINRELSHHWTAFAAASLSHSLIQDNVIYAYGSAITTDPNTGYTISACPNAPDAPVYFFCPDGTYGIYDYRNPGELRIDAAAQAMATGHIQTGAVTQDVTLGGELFLRSVRQPGFYTAAEPYSADGIVQDGAVYTYLGPENIYQPMTAYPIESPVEQAGPRRLYVDSHQASAVLQDRIHIPGRIQLIAGVRYDSLHDHNYSPYATCYDPSSLDPSTVPNPDPCAPVLTDKPVWLPQFAATFTPISSLTLYANYGVVLSLGPQAPFWTDNGSQFLSPFYTRQVEAGAKYEPGQRILLTAAFFRMRSPFFYPELLAAPNSDYLSCAAGDECFVSQGRETHDGIELNAEGKAASWLKLNASAAAMNADSSNTGTPSYDNKQVINVPHLHTAVFADLSLPRMHGLHLMPGWSYTGRKEATRDDLVSVPGYNLLNLGARYTPGGEQGRVTFRLFADNITNKRYWSDTGASYGDTFIWLGAPPTVRLSAHYTF